MTEEEKQALKNENELQKGNPVDEYKPATKGTKEKSFGEGNI